MKTERRSSGMRGLPSEGSGAKGVGMKTERRSSPAQRAGRCGSRARARKVRRALVVVALVAGAIVASASPAMAGSPLVALERKPVLHRAGGCRAYGWLVNKSKAHHVAVLLVKTQHLFSGKHQQKIGVVLVPGQRRRIGCVDWRGAMRPVDYKVLEAWIYDPRPWWAPRPVEPPKGQGGGAGK